MIIILERAVDLWKTGAGLCKSPWTDRLPTGFYTALLRGRFPTSSTAAAAIIHFRPIATKDMIRATLLRKRIWGLRPSACESECLPREARRCEGGHY